MSVFVATLQYIADNVATIVIAGKEYGTGCSRDWAAKGPLLLGVKAVRKLGSGYEKYRYLQYLQGNIYRDTHHNLTVL